MNDFPAIRKDIKQPQSRNRGRMEWESEVWWWWVRWYVLRNTRIHHTKTQFNGFSAKWCFCVCTTDGATIFHFTCFTSPLPYVYNVFGFTCVMRWFNQILCLMSVIMVSLNGSWWFNEVVSLYACWQLVYWLVEDVLGLLSRAKEEIGFTRKHKNNIFQDNFTL